MREIGTPVERTLTQSKLPTLIEDIPGEYVSALRASEFGGRCGELEGPGEISWLAAKRFDGSRFSDGLRASLASEVTVKHRLNKLFALGRLESTQVSYRCVEVGALTQIACEMPFPLRSRGAPVSEFVLIAVMIDVVRSLAGRQWTPHGISFKARATVADAAQQAFPNTRFVTDAPFTSIWFPTAHLAISAFQRTTAEQPLAGAQAEVDELTALRRIVRPYLREASAKLPYISDIVEKSPRSFQRYLSDLGTSYSQIVDAARFELITEMLADTDNSMSAIADAAGYESQSNFGRAFRRMTGTSPGQYRHKLEEFA